MTAATARPQTAMKRLAGVLSFLCLVLFLLAIEQKQTVAAWDALRHEAVPALQRVADWAGRLPSGAADGLDGFKDAVAGDDGPVAQQGSAAILRGEYAPVDDAARAVAGVLTFMGAEMRFETGDRLRTRPLRIAYGRDSFAPGQSFAARWNAPADAQIELRSVVAAGPRQAVPPAKLCEGDAPGVVALLHRAERVDVMLFRPGFVIGPDTPPAALCGAWSFAAR